MIGYLKWREMDYLKWRVRDYFKGRRGSRFSDYPPLRIRGVRGVRH